MTQPYSPPSPSLNTHPRDEREHYDAQLAAQRERFDEAPTGKPIEGDMTAHKWESLHDDERRCITFVGGYSCLLTLEENNDAESYVCNSPEWIVFVELCAATEAQQFLAMSGNGKAAEEYVVLRCRQHEHLALLFDLVKAWDERRLGHMDDSATCTERLT